MKKNLSIEILQPVKDAQSEANLEKLAHRVAQMLSQGPSRRLKQPDEMDAGELTNEVLPQPWFLPREISNEILRLLPVPHQDKWRFFFIDWGCICCQSKNV